MKGGEKMYIDAIMWFFCMNRAQAEQYYLNLVNANELSTLYDILKAYQNQPKMSYFSN